jgi:hypothetical protein
MRAMAKQSDCSANLKLDIPRSQALIVQVKVNHDIVVDHDLEWLIQETTGSLFAPLARHSTRRLLGDTYSEVTKFEMNVRKT